MSRRTRGASHVLPVFSAECGRGTVCRDCWDSEGRKIAAHGARPTFKKVPRQLTDSLRCLSHSGKRESPGIVQSLRPRPGLVPVHCHAAYQVPIMQVGSADHDLVHHQFSCCIVWFALHCRGTPTPKHDPGSALSLTSTWYLRRLRSSPHSSSPLRQLAANV